MTCKLHEATDDRADPAPVHLLLPGIILLLQRFLTDYTQDTISDHSQFQLVAIKFTKRQPYNIHVHLDLIMVLLALSMSMIQINDFLIRQGKACPICAKLNLQNNEELLVLVKSALNDLVNRPDANGLFGFVQ